MSSTEARYIASIDVIKEGSWLNGFVEELFGNEEHITLHCDSQIALFLMKRSKHIEENPADTMSTPLPSNKFQHCLC